MQRTGDRAIRHGGRACAEITRGGGKGGKNEKKKNYVQNDVDNNIIVQTRRGERAWTDAVVAVGRVPNGIGTLYVTIRVLGDDDDDDDDTRHRDERQRTNPRRSFRTRVRLEHLIALLTPSQTSRQCQNDRPSVGRFLRSSNIVSSK